MIFASIYDRRKKYFILSFFSCLLLAVLVLFFIYKKNIFLHLLIYNILPFSFAHFLNIFSLAAVRHALIFGLLFSFFAVIKDKKSVFFWYPALIPLTLIFAFKTGSEANYFIEFIACSCIFSGIVLAKMVSEKKFIVSILISQGLLFLPFKPAPVFTKTYGQELPFAIYNRPSAGLKEAGELIVSELISSPEPVLSYDTGWLIAAEKEIIIAPYQFSQLAKYGRWDDSSIVDMVKEKQFSLILMDAVDYEKTGERFTKRMMQAIKENYSIRRVIGNFYILEPSGWNF